MERGSEKERDGKGGGWERREGNEGGVRRKRRKSGSEGGKGRMGGYTEKEDGKKKIERGYM